MTRRDFLKTQTAFAVGTSTGLPLDWLSPKRLKSIGLILGLVRAEMEKDWEGTLEQLAGWGYSELEFSGHYGASPEVFRAKLAELSMKAVAVMY